MSPKSKVLFIDDEPFFARTYVEKLEKDFEVFYNDNVQDGLQSIRNQHELRCLILDIMMPPPDGVANDQVEDGVATGIWLLGQILPRIQNKGRPLPVCVLTNRRPSVVVEATSKLRISTDLITVRHKSDTPAFYLPKLVTQLIERHYPRE